MRSLPEKPALRQLKIQAKELVKAVRSAQPEALKRIRDYFPPPISLTQAQLVVAREHGFDSWIALGQEVERRTLEGRIREAIDSGDLTRVREIFRDRPEAVSTRMRWCNRGNPFVYAAQSGQLEIMRWLAERGPTDLQLALSRAAMRYRPRVMEELIEMGADPAGPYSESYRDYAVISAVAEALNPDAMRALVELGAPVRWADEQGREHSVPALLLTIYSRDAPRKAACLDVCEQAGIVFPDTPAMRIHRRHPEGVDVRAHLTIEDIYPAELGCKPGDEATALPIAGATPLHLAVELDDGEIAEALLRQGADPNARITPGGHSPIFHTVLTFGRRTDEMARILIGYGADPSLRATVKRDVYSTEELDPHEERVFERVTAQELGSEAWPSWLKNRPAVDYLAGL